MQENSEKITGQVNVHKKAEKIYILCEVLSVEQLAKWRALPQKFGPFTQFRDNQSFDR